MRHKIRPPPYQPHRRRQHRKRLKTHHQAKHLLPIQAPPLSPLLFREHPELEAATLRVQEGEGREHREDGAGCARGGGDEVRAQGVDGLGGEGREDAGGEVEGEEEGAAGGRRGLIVVFVLGCRGGEPGERFVQGQAEEPEPEHVEAEVGESGMREDVGQRGDGVGGRGDGEEVAV